MTPDGTRVYVTNNADGTISVIATATNTVMTTIPVGPGVSAVAVTPDGAQVYVAHATGQFTGGFLTVIATATIWWWQNRWRAARRGYSSASSYDSFRSITVTDFRNCHCSHWLGIEQPLTPSSRVIPRLATSRRR